MAEQILARIQGVVILANVLTSTEVRQRTDDELRLLLTSTLSTHPQAQPFPIPSVMP